MFTQCPHCLTLFRITPGQLKAANGKVRCCQCNSVFNALQSLLETPAAFTNTPPDQNEIPILERRRETDQSAIQLSPKKTTSSIDIESSLVSDSEVEKSLDALVDDDLTIHQLMEDSILEVDENTSEIDSHGQFILEQDDGLETEPDYLDAGSESQMSALLDQDSASLLLNESSELEEELAEVIELEVIETPPPTQESPDDFDIDTDQQVDEASPEEILTEPDTPSSPPPEEQPTTHAPTDEEKPFTFEKQHEESPSNRPNYPWIFACLFLMIPLAGQIIWLSRDSLIHNEIGRQLLTGVCRIASCEVPIRRATDKILISERTLTTHPDIENVLSLQLEMVNTASFQQPYPMLQLSLYNDIGNLIARRTFSPNEYKASQQGPLKLMPKLQATHAQLDLVDPGDDVTGFKFDFL